MTTSQRLRHHALPAVNILDERGLSDLSHAHFVESVRLGFLTASTGRASSHKRYRRRPSFFAGSGYREAPWRDFALLSMRCVR